MTTGNLVKLLPISFMSVKLASKSWVRMVYMHSHAVCVCLCVGVVCDRELIDNNGPYKPPLSRGPRRWC